LGKLSEDDLEPVAVHVERCSDCQSTLASFATDEDSLVSGLRKLIAEPKHIREPALEQAVRRVASMDVKLYTAVAGCSEESRNDPPTLDQLREYQLLEKLGAGGMGTVYKALHTKLKRVFALKVLAAERMRHPEAVARFQREMEAVGRLKHPNIVGATDAGEVEGTHFLVMEFVEGLDLSNLVDRFGPLPIVDACAVVRQAAMGLQHAYEHGLVHRDIKPSNLMLTPAGQVKLLDMGLARLCGERPAQEELTGTGAMMGTADYMAPEQVSDSHSADHRADLYSLGCTLYKLLTGHVPFSGNKYSSTFQKLKAHVEEAVPSISEKRPGVTADLATVVDRLLAKTPSDRFQTPSQVVEALEPLTVGSDLPALLRNAREAKRPEEEPDRSLPSTAASISSALSDTNIGDQDEKVAEPVSSAEVMAPAEDRKGAQSAAPETATRKEQRNVLVGSHRGWRPAALASAMILSVFGFFAAPTIVRFATGKGTLVVEIDDAKVEATFHSEGLTIHDVDRGRTYTLNVNSKNLDPGNYRIELTSDAGLRVDVNKFTLRRGGRAVVKVTLEPLGGVAETGRLATSPPRLWKPGPAENVLPGLIQRPAELPGVGRWQVETRAPRASAHVVAWSPDGQYLACGCGDHQVRIYEVSTLRLHRLFLGHTGGVLSVCWSPDGRWLASAGGWGDRTVRLWNVAQGKSGPVLVGHSHNYGVNSVTWNPDGTRIASAGADGAVRLWDAVTGKPGPVLTGHVQKHALSVSWSPDGRWIASSGFDRTVRLWDATAAEPGFVFKDVEQRVRAVAWSPDGKRLAGARHGGGVLIWNFEDDRLQLDFKLDTVSSTAALAWSPDGKRLACVGTADGNLLLTLKDETGRKWDVHRYHENPSPEERLLSVAWNPDGTLLASGSLYGTLRLWDPDSGVQKRVLTGRLPGVRSVAWSPDSRRVASGGDDTTIRLWNADDGRPELVLHGHTGPVVSTAWSPDAKRLVSAGSEEKVVRLWSADDGAPGPSLLGHTGAVTSVAWSPDGRRFASGSKDKTVRLWAAENGRTVHVLRGHTASVNSVAWNPDGRQLASASDDTTVRLWQTEDGAEATVLQGHAGAARAVAWSRDGRWLASGTANKMIHLWNANDGKPGVILQGHDNFVNAVAWSPDGPQLASCCTQGTVRMWDAVSGSQVRLLADHVHPLDSIAWSPDGARLAWGGGDGTLQVCDARTGEPSWMALMLPQSQPALFSGGGELLSDEPAVESMLVYVVEKSSGELELLTPTEFGRRVSTGRPTAAASATVWPPGPADNVLPGLIPRPTQLPGRRRWQLETVGPRGKVYAVAWSPDGRFLACGSADRQVRIYDVSKKQLVRLYVGHTGTVRSVHWSPDGKRLASVGERDDRTIRLWSFDDRKLDAVLRGHTNYVYSVAWSADGKYLASAGTDDTVRIWNVATGKSEQTLQGHSDDVASVAWSPDGQWLASGSYDGTVRLWKSADGKPGPVLDAPLGSVHSVAWSPDGRWLASGGNDDQIRLWNADNFEPAPGPRYRGIIEAVAWSPDGKNVLAGCADGVVRAWKLGPPESRITLTLKHLGRYVQSVAWSPDGKWLASGGNDGSVRLWNSIDGSPDAVFGKRCAVHTLDWNADGRQLASAVSDGTIRLWQAVNGEAGRVLTGHKGPVASVAWSPDSRKLASGGRDRTVRLWDAAGANKANVLGKHAGYVASIVWSPDGQRLASGGDDHAIRLWNVTDGKPGPVLAGHNGTVHTVDWSPDGRHLVSCARDKTARLWDIRTGKVQASLTFSDPINSSAWDRDGLRVVLGSNGGNVRFWNPMTMPGQAYGGHHNHSDSVLSVAWNPDGELVASTSHDTTVRLWNSNNGHEAAVLKGHAFAVGAVSWSPDGQRLASGGDGSTIRIWDSESGEAIRVLLLLPNGEAATFSTAGHLVSHTPAAEKELVYVVETPEGQLELLSSAQFHEEAAIASGNSGNK
jgi:WD40 repeat protein/serine/threonine protein kinase